MAKIMTKTIKFPEPIILAPLPTASSRIRYRGYDQSNLLVNEISKIINRPKINFLLKNNQSQQVGATKKDRQENAKIAYRIKNKKLIAGACIMLVDDVMTTGSSLESAARLLLANGAKNVDAIVFSVANNQHTSKIK
jgi:ComF family protein